MRPGATPSPYGPNGAVYPGYPPLLPGKFLRHMRDMEDPHGTLKLAKQVRIVDEIPGDETLASYNAGDLVVVSSIGQLYRVVSDPSTGARSLEPLPFSAETDVKPFPRYLHYLRFDDSYDADANAWYDSLSPSAMGGACSAIRRGAVLGRNYDWNYDEAAEFVVGVGAAKGANSDGSDRHSSVGVASLGSALTESEATGGTYTPKIRVLPGMTLDGINDSGVVAEINVVPRGSGDPVRSSVRNLHPLAVVRHVLDRFSSAEDAAEYVAARYYIPSTSAYSFHWMIADASKTFIVEDGVCHEVDGTDCSMTNHRLYAFDVYGTGYARKGVLDGSADVWSALSSTLFTNAYATGWPWPDEFSGDANIPHTESAALREWANAHVAPHLDPQTRKPKARDGVLWHTVHSSVYDIASRTLAVSVQESGVYFVFSHPGGGGALDDTVTETSESGVKSSGIWSWVKSLLPSWLVPGRAEPPTMGDVEAAILANVENSTTSSSATKSLSANMGRELQDQIQNLKQRGRYLSIWDCSTGLAKTEPTVNPYPYKAGDYFIIGMVASTGGTNYRPNGASYDKTVASTTVETGIPSVNDTYYYDGTSWSLLHTEQAAVTWNSVTGKPSTFPPSSHSHVTGDVTGLEDSLVKKVDSQVVSYANRETCVQFTNIGRIVIQWKDGWSSHTSIDKMRIVLESGDSDELETGVAYTHPVVTPLTFADGSVTRSVCVRGDPDHNAIKVYLSDTTDGDLTVWLKGDGDTREGERTTVLHNRAGTPYYLSFVDNLTTTAAREKIADAMPAPIDPSTATVSGKAADALRVKNALSGKLDKTDVIAPSIATATGKAADALAVKNALNGKANTSGGNIFYNDQWVANGDLNLVGAGFYVDRSGVGQDYIDGRWNGDYWAFMGTKRFLILNGLDFSSAMGAQVPTIDGVNIATLNNLALKLDKTDVVAPSTATATGKAADALSVKNELAGKIDNPSGGSIGNVLTKTVGGVEWSHGGGEDEKTQIVFDALADMDDFTDDATETDVFDVALTKLSQLLGEDVAA